MYAKMNMTLNSSLQDEQFRYDCWVAEIPLYGLVVNILNSSLDSSEHLDFSALRLESCSLSAVKVKGQKTSGSLLCRSGRDETLIRKSRTSSTCVSLACPCRVLGMRSSCQTQLGYLTAGSAVRNITYS